MKVDKRWPLFGLILILLLALPAYRLLLGKAVDAVRVERTGLVETVVATGRVITPARVALGTQMAGTLAEVRVREGDRVHRGEVVARLVSDEQAAALAQATRAVAEAEARLEQQGSVDQPVAEEAQRQAEANLKLAEQDYDRTRRLVEAGFYSPSKLDESRRGLDTARAALKAAAAQAAGSAPSGADTRVLQTRLAQARSARDLARARLDQTRVVAPGDGLILTRLAEPGDVVTVGKKLFDLAVAGERQIDLLVDEKNLSRLAVGQSAQALADAYPDRPFKATLFYIAPGVDAQTGSVEVKLAVPESPDFVKPDMTVSVEIETGRKAAALTLPDRLIHGLDGEHPWVLAVESGRAEKRPVEVGLRGQGRVEIVSGLKQGEAVIPPEAGAAAGDRVRPGAG